MVGAIDIKAPGGKLALPDGSTIPFADNPEQIITSTGPDVIVDFTLAPATMPLVRVAAKNKVNLVIGTTGLTQENISRNGTTGHC